MEEQIPEILYHYCSVDTFLSIVQNKTLRLSEISKSNDSMECRWLEKEIFPRVFGKEIDAFVKSLNENADPAKIREGGEKIFNYPYVTKKFKLDEKFVLAICFSKQPDLLSQWRAYANDGMGVSIGFGADLFERNYNPSNFSYVNLRKVIYDQDAQEAEIFPEIRMFVEILKRELEKIKHGEEAFRNPLITIETLPLWVSLLQKSIYLKNDGFKAEEEWRLYASFPTANSFLDLQEAINEHESLKCFGEFGVVSRTDKVVYYINLLLEKANPSDQKLGWIKKIYIGPKCKLSTKDILFLLESNGWDTRKLEVIKSGSTYM